MKRLMVTTFAALGIAALSPAAASASVLVEAPYPFTKKCGANIQLGIWNKDDGRPSALTVTMSIRTLSGRVVWHKRARATSSWRNWRYKPACGRRYIVRYRNATFGTDSYRVRIRG
jgi:hypothetical protein